MGFIKHPLFTWMPRFGHILQWVYWPTFLLALFYISTGTQKAKAQRLLKYCIIGQALLGAAMLVPAVFFPETAFPYVAWPLLYGPNLGGASSDMSSYIASLICLLPLAWMGIIKFASSARSNEPIAPSYGISVFWYSAVSLSLLYSIQSAILSHLSRAAFLQESAVSLVLYLIVFTAVFTALQIADRFAKRTKHPRAAQDAIRGIAAAFLVMVIVRKVLLYAVAFNTSLGDVYAVLFSLAVVLYVAPSVTARKRQVSDDTGKQMIRTLNFVLVGRQLLILSAATAIDLLALRLIRLDWNQVIGSLSTLLIWGLTFCFFTGFHRKRSVDYGPVALAFLAVPVGIALTVLVVLSSGFALSSSPGKFQETVDKYAGYDPSIYVMQNVLRPSVNDGADVNFYSFLNKHANIEGAVSAPDISFVEDYSTAEGPKPNIFVFVIDALRKDYLSPYNPKVGFTPNIQRFADESVVFKDPMTLYGGTALAEPAIWTGVQEIHKHYPYPFPRMNALSKMLEADNYHSYVAYDFTLTRLVPETSNVTILRKGFKAWQESEFGKVLTELEDDLLKRTDPERPVFAYSQPANVHSLVLGDHSEAIKHPHPGFNADYAFALETVDHELGQFVRFLKDQGMYENSVVILTADHGESLGDWGRWGHISIAPEIMRIPLIIHVPDRLRNNLFRDTEKPAFLEDITPSIYYLAGHHALKRGEMFGRSLFAHTANERVEKSPDHYFMMSSYMPIFGILTSDEKGLYIVDASLRRTSFYDLGHDPAASENRITVALKRKYEQLVREDLKKIDAFYHVDIPDHSN
jgi:hypothetical protein